MDITLGEETITTFRAALERVAALAHARLPQELHGHLERAHALVRHGHVFPTDDGKHAQVLSSDGARWYPVNGHCTCMDAPKAPQGLCKHRLAFGLYRRASELLAAAARPQPAAFPQAPFGALLQEAGVTDWGPARAALPEAPASVNCHVLIEGHSVQVTLRDTDEDRLLTRLAALLTRYPAAPKAGTSDKASAAAPTSTPAAGGTPTCPYHGGMRESTKVKGTFYCPSRMGDGTFCKEKFPKK